MTEAAAATEATTAAEGEATTAAEGEATTAPPPSDERQERVEEGDEKPECGFCVFMKAGGCAEAFEAWSRCVDAAREGEKKSEGEDASSPPASAADDPPVPDFATRCRDATMALQRCMEEHRDYYKDFLADAEEAVAARGEEGGGGGDEKKGEEKGQGEES